MSLDGPTRSTLRRSMRCPGSLTVEHLDDGENEIDESAVTTYRSVRGFHGFSSRIASAVATLWLLIVGRAGMQVYLLALFYTTLFELGDLRLPLVG